MLGAGLKFAKRGTRDQSAVRCKQNHMISDGFHQRFVNLILSRFHV